MSGTRFLIMLFALLFISCTPPEEPSDTDEPTDSDIPVTDIDPNEQITFPDLVLRACVEELTGKNSGDPIYAKNVANITEIVCDGVSNLTGMEYFSKLGIAVFDNGAFDSLQSLSQLANIYNLQISQSNVKTLSEISMLVNLTDLSFVESELEDITALAGMEKLIRVQISDGKLKSLTSLAFSESIEHINVLNNPTLTTLGAQFTAPKLQTLNVSNCALTSLNELSGLSELKSIDASDNYITETSFISTLPKIEGLNLDGNCLEGNQLQTYVNWWNEHHPDFPTTYEQELSVQEPSKCQ